MATTASILEETVDASMATLPGSAPSCCRCQQVNSQCASRTPVSLPVKLRHLPAGQSDPGWAAQNDCDEGGRQDDGCQPHKVIWASYNLRTLEKQGRPQLASQTDDSTLSCCIEHCHQLLLKWRCAACALEELAKPPYPMHGQAIE